jgi:hypothetical protein
MIDWKKFAAENGGYMTAWKDGKLYIAGPELRSCYAIVAETPEKIEPCGWVEKVDDLNERISETRRNTGFIPLSNIVGDSLEGYVHKRVECDCAEFPSCGCEDCDGLGYWMEWPKQSITHEDRHLAKDVLRVLSLLPGVQVSLGANTHSEHYFVFDGGEGVFMGLSRPYEK